MPGRVPSVSWGSTPWGLPIADLDAGVEYAAHDLDVLQGSRVLVTGGTGFLGSWLVASLLRANERLNLGLQLVLLSRDPGAVPLVEGPALHLLPGDVRSLPDPGSVDIIVHGATSSSSTGLSADGQPAQMASTIIGGTLAVLELAKRCHARLLMLSSGAVYGPQLNTVAEDCNTAPDPLSASSVYAQAKRLAEALCAAAAEAGDVTAVIARLFAFVGPRIPLDAHFAAGNFLNDALRGQSIAVQGDGRPRRSYLYAGDLPEWCWALLTRGRPGVAYNVGSPEPVTIEELAWRTARLVSPPADVHVLGPRDEGPPPWYVPSTARAELEFGLRPRTDLDTALHNTYKWLIARRASSA